jgi:hypothetical protein
MAKKHVIDQDSVKSYEIKQDDSIWIVKQGVTVDAPGWHVFDNATHSASNVEFVIEGQLGGANSAMVSGIATNGRDSRIEIADTGSITGGDWGITSVGKNTEIVNDGTISGSVNGIQLSGVDFKLTNSGLITTTDLMNGKSIYVSTAFANGKIINDVGGTITGMVDANNGGPVTFINKGTITDLPNISIEVYLSQGDDTFVNRGTLNGAAFLGDGKDIADLRNGSTTSIVSGWEGNDIYIVNQNDGQAYEYAGQGIDTLKTSVNFTATQAGEMERFVAIGKSNITIIANDLDNKVTGNNGKNFLDGTGGDDDLRGRGGVDIFNFGTGDDSDRIMDFENGKDVVNVASWINVNDFADIQAIASKVGKDIVLTLGTDELTLRDTKMSELDASDFIF